jgi:hypothetical protein
MTLKVRKAIRKKVVFRRRVGEPAPLQTPKFKSTFAVPDDGWVNLKTISAKMLDASATLYEVSCAHDHDTLREGDLVWVVADQQEVTVLMRTDWTIHKTSGRPTTDNKAGWHVYLRTVPTKVMR